jgi:hypothetical protein
MQHSSEDQLELALDLYRAGIDTETHMLLTAANNLLAMGYQKWVNVTVPLAELNENILRTRSIANQPDPLVVQGDEAAAEDLAQKASIAQGMDHPDYQQNPNGELPPDPVTPYQPRGVAPDTTRMPKPAGTQWHTDFVNPNNTVMPKDWIEKVWSGWALNGNQQAVMKMMTGEKGRYTLGIKSITNYIRKYGKVKPGQDPSARKHIKPHTLTNSLIRRGLVMELDRDVFILTPRGTLYVREMLGVEPTPRLTAVEAVAD